MLKSIFKKEWLKLKFYFFVLLAIIIITLIHFAFNLNFSFKTIEPESMMWYKFAHLQDKPYFYLSYFFLILGATISFAQYIPEKISKRIKIMAHLPLNLRDSIFGHLLIGISFVLLLCAILSLGLILVLIKYYPYEIVQIALKDIFFYVSLSLIFYIGLSSVILETKNKIIFVKFAFVSILITVFLKERYETNDLIFMIFLFFVPFLVLDSFYSIKQQRLNTNIFKASFGILALFLVFLSYLNYTQNYKYNFNKYYLFYSNIVSDFVYQKNFGDHQYEYGIKDKETFDQYRYESYLPFVYWRNLDIQNKLPIIIGKKTFDKNTIKDARLSFEYTPAFLKKPEVELYPLLNPISNIGMIKFPEEVFTLTNNEVKVYDYDNRYLKDQSNDLSKKLKDLNFVYPALNIWGKTTNMKPFDKGYLIKDSKGAIFNIAKSDNQITATKIKTPEGIDVAFIGISENKQKILSGYAISANNEFYLLTWNFDFIKLDLENFDHKTMKLRLIANPINYVIRYDDSKKYYASVFSKDDYKKIDSVVLD